MSWSVLICKYLQVTQENWVRSLSWEDSPGRRKWQPTPVFLPGKSDGQRSLVGYSSKHCRVRHNWVTEYAVEVWLQKWSDFWQGVNLTAWCSKWDGDPAFSPLCSYLLFSLFLLSSCFSPPSSAPSPSLSRPKDFWGWWDHGLHLCLYSFPIQPFKKVKTDAPESCLWRFTSKYKAPFLQFSFLSCVFKKSQKINQGKELC